MTSRDTRAELHFPFTTPPPLTVPPEFAELRAGCPVARVAFPTGYEGWLVSSYEHVRTVLTDPRFSRAAVNRPDAPVMRPIIPDSRSLLKKDGAEHARLRKIAVRAFSVASVRELRPFIARTADSLLDDMVEAGPPADLVSAYAQPLAMAVICRVMGVPYEDRQAIASWFGRLLGLFPNAAGEISAARWELDAYISELVDAKRSAPGDDALSSLISAHDNGELTGRELTDLGWSLLFTGYPSQWISIANAVLRLLRHPDQLDLLRARPNLLRGAVEESLRVNPFSVAGILLRIALEDVRLGGVTIRAGESVVPAAISANRDESVFPDADTFDIRRTPNPQLAFGKGPHFCLAARLSRVEIEVALKAILRRLPGLEVAGGGNEIRVRDDMVLYALTAVPVTW
ncbi:cytochrome P450 [Actinomadura fulvescens]|uniref:Cytochrome P450 n=1 Tax=Actinomadura fulvescens TaxID=46160 RepID=A0ABN3QKJ1_9ACTN